MLWAKTNNSSPTSPGKNGILKAGSMRGLTMLKTMSQQKKFDIYGKEVKKTGLLTLNQEDKLSYGFATNITRKSIRLNPDQAL